jgi:hypothetical protein
VRSHQRTVCRCASKRRRSRSWDRV